MADFDEASAGKEADVEELNETLSGETKKAMAARIGLNDNKAGMEGLDKEKINKIIYEASKGSRFYENELKKDKVIQEKINSLKDRLAEASQSQLKECLEKADTLLASLSSQYDFTRYIVHMDMDAFYAAVEMRDNPKLRDVPMAVGDQSMLCTSNYIARRYGVRAAMPGFIARKLCPQLVLVPGNMPKYTAISRVIRQVLRQYDPEMTPMSLDEAYIDFTDHMNVRAKFSDAARTLPGYNENMCRCEPVAVATRQPAVTARDVPGDKGDEMDKTEEESAPDTDCSVDAASCPKCKLPINPSSITFGICVEEAVREMRHRIHLKTKLTASAGIAANSLLAKICSDKNKPNGQYMLPFDVEHMQEFTKDLPIRKVPGIGKVSEKQLLAFDIKTCEDFYKHRDVLCFLYSGGSFEYFLSIYMGLGSNRVAKNDEGPKSKSVERTFRDMSEPSKLLEMCHHLSLELAEDLKSSSDLMGKTVTLKIKLATFEVKTRAQSLPIATNNGEEINIAASNLLKIEMKNVHPKPLVLRLMGIRMSNFSTSDTKQTKLKVSKVTATSDSFFDLVSRENQKKSTQKKAEPLGLLAYMSGYNPSTSKLHSDSAGLGNLSLKKRSVWDEYPETTPQKAPKPGSKGEVSICSLLDSDSTTDPWDALNKDYPMSSTPHTSKGKLSLANKKRPLDFSSVTTNFQESINSSKSKKRTVDSYFTATKSVWDEFYQSSDDDIVCVSDARALSRKNDKKNSKPKTGRGGTKSLKRGSKSQRLLTPTKKPLRCTKNSNRVNSCEVITLDSD